MEKVGGRGQYMSCIGQSRKPEGSEREAQSGPEERDGSLYPGCSHWGNSIQARA